MGRSAQHLVVISRPTPNLKEKPRRELAPATHRIGLWRRGRACVLLAIVATCRTLRIERNLGVCGWLLVAVKLL
jgi:hypothetical protein